MGRINGKESLGEAIVFGLISLNVLAQPPCSTRANALGMLYFSIAVDTEEVKPGRYVYLPVIERGRIVLAVTKGNPSKTMIVLNW